MSQVVAGCSKYRPILHFYKADIVVINYIQLMKWDSIYEFANNIFIRQSVKQLYIYRHTYHKLLHVLWIIVDYRFNSRI